MYFLIWFFCNKHFNFIYRKICKLVNLSQTESESESCSVVSSSLWPHGLNSPWNSPGQNTGVGSLSLLQGIFPAQGLNPGLPHCRQILSHRSHQESLRNVPKLKKHRTQCLKKCHQDVACLSSIGSAFLCIWLHSQIDSHLDSATWVSSSLKLILY